MQWKHPSLLGDEDKTQDVNADSQHVVFFWVGDDSRGGSPGAQRFQEETRLRAGDIWRFARGKLKVCVCT